MLVTTFPSKYYFGAKSAEHNVIFNVISRRPIMSFTFSFVIVCEIYAENGIQILSPTPAMNSEILQDDVR